MSGRFIKLLSLVFAALSLAPSYAHVLEAGPRLRLWSPALWRDATVFHAQFANFAIFGAPVDVLAIAVIALLAWHSRFERPGLWFGAASAGLFLVALFLWAAVVAPANAVLATWRPGPIPASFAAVRARWETGHMIVAAVKALGFLALCLAIVFPGRRSTLLS